MSSANINETLLRQDADKTYATSKKAEAVFRKIRQDEPLQPMRMSFSRNYFIRSYDGDKVTNQTKLRMIIESAKSKDPEVQLEAVQVIRELLSNVPSGKNPPIDDLIDLNALPILVDCLRQEENPFLQVEAAWSLTNIAAGNSLHTRAVVRAGAVPLLADLLQSSSYDKVCEQAVWALCNIAGDGPECRDCVTQHNVVPFLLRFIRPGSSTAFLRNVAWMMVNLCRDEERPAPAESIGQLISALGELIRLADDKVLGDTVKALSYISRGSLEAVQMIVDSTILPSLIPLLGNGVTRMAALNVVADVAAGTEEHKQALLDNDVTKYLSDLLLPLKRFDGVVTKAAATVVSNIAAGNRDQVQALIDSGIIPMILYHLGKANFEVQKEVVRTVRNLTTNGDSVQVAYLVGQRLIPHLCSLITADDQDVLKMILESLRNILNSYGPNLGPVAKEIEVCGGLDKIESVQNPENKSVYDLTCVIIERCFPDEQNSIEPNVVSYETWDYEFEGDHWT